MKNKILFQDEEIKIIEGVELWKGKEESIYQLKEDLFKLPKTIKNRNGSSQTKNEGVFKNERRNF